MPPKDAKKGLKTPTTAGSTYGEHEQTIVSPRSVSLSLELIGDAPGPGDWNFITLFNGHCVLDGKWQNGLMLETDSLPLDLKDPYYQDMVADKPIIFLLRIAGGKGAKDPDPLLNPDNRAGGTVDLLPLVLGEQKVFTRVNLVFIATGQKTSCIVEVKANISDTLEPLTKVPLLLTMISAQCLPYAKDGTVYLSAIGLDDVLDTVAVNFGMSLSSSTASKLVWASVSNGGQAANTAYEVPSEDKFIPLDFEPSEHVNCKSMYWNAIKRVLVDPILLRERLSSPLLVEIAGVPRVGKIDVRGRYMAFIDAKVLLEPGQFGATICTKLLFFSESDLPPNIGPLLELPPTSAKVSARETDLITDEFGHTSYITLRMDLIEPLEPKAKIASLFDVMGLPLPDGPSAPVDELVAPLVPEDTSVDVRRIRKEGGALAVHKELSGLACRGAVPMNQGIKRTAANRLLMRVRTMLKQFSPGDCTEIDWQDTVTGQHAASRRAVTSSFAPQPPPLRPPPRVAAARCRLAGDTRIADKHLRTNLKVTGAHPRSLLSKALRCLEERNDTEARKYLREALSAQSRNRFCLWAYGAQEFNKGKEGREAASAAFKISVKGDYSEGTANAIGWAALHALYHHNNNPYSAFVAAKKMRKFYELSTDWKQFLQRWLKTSGEEEIFWTPGMVRQVNPMMISAAFFLCLRCFAFSERLLKCVEQGCATRGSHRGLKTNITCDLYYIRAASLIIRRKLDEALKLTNSIIKKLGPSAMMSQMRATCLFCIKGWDGTCEDALQETDKAGADPLPFLLLKAATGGLNSDPKTALQRAARAHKISPCAHSALTISRIYAKLNEDSLAERWAAAAVKLEPFLADAWAFLSLLAMYQRNLDKARTMLRTAKQVGPISPDIEEEMKKVKDIVQLDTLSDSLVKNLCLCEYY